MANSLPRSLMASSHHVLSAAFPLISRRSHLRKISLFRSKRGIDRLSRRRRRRRRGYGAVERGRRGAAAGVRGGDRRRRGEAEGRALHPRRQEPRRLGQGRQARPPPDGQAPRPRPHHLKRPKAAEVLQHAFFQPCFYVPPSLRPKVPGVLRTPPSGGLKGALEPKSGRRYSTGALSALKPASDSATLKSNGSSRIGVQRKLEMERQALCTRLQPGLEQKVVLPRNSYLQDYFDDLAKYRRIGPPFYFVVKDFNYRF